MITYIHKSRNKSCSLKCLALDGVPAYETPASTIRLPVLALCRCCIRPTLFRCPLTRLPMLPALPAYRASNREPQR